ncbi:MAG: B12-binding domain-containing radical SAM protein [Candidatus Omnitrophica bacterium]|nr:B12-binding domain-containing radical SAM protein [Candidatus Omnitrophota bacterium]
MRVSIINPDSDTAKSQGKYSIFGTAMPPMGIAYLATRLTEENSDIQIIDQYVEKISNNQLIERIRSFNPQIIGISCLTAAMGNVEKLVAQMKKENFKAKIVLGNIHASLFADQLLKEDKADIIVRGEGEDTFSELVHCLAKEDDYSGIKGISYSQDDKIIHNPDRNTFVDLDKNSFPNWDLLPYQKYNSVPLLGVDNEILLHIQASRGCPYKCYFCSQENMHHKVRVRKVKSVVDEIEYQSRKYNVNKFAFVDSYFPMTEEYGFTFAEEMIKRGLHKKIKWATETRVDKVSYRLLEKLKQAGMSLIMYGFESGEQAILDSCNKHITVEQSKVAMRHTKNLKIPSLGFFILGLPGDTRQSINKTIKFAQELDCDLVKFNIAIPTPGSKFFEIWKKDNPDADLSPEKFSSWYSPEEGGKMLYLPKGINSKELEGLRAKAMISYYLRPKVIFRSLSRGLISLGNIFKGMKVLMSEFSDNYSEIIRFPKSKACNKGVK